MYTHTPPFDFISSHLYTPFPNLIRWKVIEQIHINPKSRDNLPSLIVGLQHLFTVPTLREQVFALLAADVNPKARKDGG